MKRFGIWAIAVLFFIFRCYQMEQKDSQIPVVFDGPTLAEYNQIRYEKYLGEPVEPLIYEEEQTECRFTDEEIYLIAKVVMSEVSIESFEVKQALAETIINRLDSDYQQFKYETTLEDVIRPGQFACNQEPTQECYDAVYAAIECNAFPDDMLWARLNYVSYGYEYTIDKDSKTKFSTVTNYNEVEE